MRICRIVDIFPSKDQIRGGLGPNYFYYSKLTADRGIDVDVVCERRKGEPEEETIDGIRIHRVCQIRGDIRERIYGEFARKSLERIKELHPDLIHGHNALHFGIVNKKEKLGIPVITHLHGSVDLYKFTDKLPFSFNFQRALKERVVSRWYHFELKYVSKKADLVIACDRYTADSVRRYCGREKPIQVIYNGVDLECFKKMESNLKEKLGADHLLLYVGRPVPWKGVQYLLRAVKGLNKEFPGLKCLLLGVRVEDGYDFIYYKWLKSIANRLSLINVIFFPSVPYFTLPEYYSGADCLVVPSYPDPSPKTVYEAQACSCPVVATNGGGIPEIFGEKSGLLFRPRDVDDMTEKIKIVLNNPERFRGGREIIGQKATWNKCAENMIKCYEYLINRSET